jgi:UDP:flavonoid glycosyltransferase YjiC (YdhE family)
MICLLPNCCFLSETSRMLEIYRALREREGSAAGIKMLTHGGPYENLLRAARVPYDVLGPGVSTQRYQEFLRSVPGIGPDDQSIWTDEELRGYAVAEAEYFARHRVRAAVTGFTLTALLSTRLAGIPLVTEHAGSFLPPVFEHGLLPAPSMPVGLPGEGFLPRRARQRLYNAAVPRVPAYTAGFNRVAAELGVEPVPSFPALLLGDLTLVTDVPELLGLPRAEVDGWTPRDPRRYRPGTRLRYTGPLYAHLDLPVPDQVRAFLAGRRPVIYVAITSSTPELVRQVVSSLVPLGARILVAATTHDLADLASDQVMVAGLLPGHLVMGEVDLAVTAGGQGSVQTALAAGVPFVGIPLQPEQDTNVTFAQSQGAARLIAQKAAGTPAMTAAARDLLDDAAARDSAARLKQIFAAVDGPAAAAEAIVEIAATHAPGSPNVQPRPANWAVDENEQGGSLWTTSRC